MRHMAFSKTIPQMRAKTKTITRRDGWLFLKPGDRLLAIEKCQGLKKGEKHVPIGVIEILSVIREPGSCIFFRVGDMRKEGFPGMTGFDFLKYILRGDPDRTITRIFFMHVEDTT